MTNMRFLDWILGRSDIAFNGSIYMKRWRIINTRWFGIRVHKIMRSDDDRDLHDHPFSFLSFILRGGYIEHTIDGRAIEYQPGSLIFRSADALHRLDLFENEIPVWTLVFRGPIRRRWGFLINGKWTDAKDVRSNQEAVANRQKNGQGRPSLYDSVVPRDT